MNFLKKIFKNKTNSKGIAAISFKTDGIALAVSQYSEKKNPVLILCEFINTQDNQQALKQMVEKHKLDQFDCHLVLASDDYRLITIDAPEVPENELAEAIRWKISELIEFNADDAILDFYPLPASDRANTGKMLEIVATPRATIQPLVDLCQQLNLQLKVIDIHETSLRNLATFVPENENGFAILHLQNNTGRIIIEQHGAIYLSRKLASGYERLGVNEHFQSNEQIALEQNGLVLEIQRSLDYVESFYGLPPIASLGVIPISENTPYLLDFLNQNHGLAARVMDLSNLINSNAVLDDKTQSLCAPVIGASLRNAVPTT